MTVCVAQIRSVPIAEPPGNGSNQRARGSQNSEAAGDARAQTRPVQNSREKRADHYAITSIKRVSNAYKNASRCKATMNVRLLAAEIDERY